VLELARLEATRSGKRAVGPEHLLLGCLRTVTGAPAEVLEDAGVSAESVRADLVNGAVAPRLDADALASIGIDLDEVRRRAEERFGPGALERNRSGSCRLDLSRSAKKTLVAAGRDARDRGRDGAEPEHVLLALLNSDEGSILREHGLAPARLRAAVLDELAG
jgi:ATP-dependent Clp protease ATP-binding subunit ClpA